MNITYITKSKPQSKPKPPSNSKSPTMNSRHAYNLSVNHHQFAFLPSVPSSLSSGCYSSAPLHLCTSECPPLPSPPLITTFNKHNHNHKPQIYPQPPRVQRKQAIRKRNLNTKNKNKILPGLRSTCLYRYRGLLPGKQDKTGPDGSGVEGRVMNEVC